MIVFLVLTRRDARIVKRRPTARPGEWVLELRVEFPPATPTSVLTVALKPEPELREADLVGHEVGPAPEPDGGEP